MESQANAMGGGGSSHTPPISPVSLIVSDDLEAGFSGGASPYPYPSCYSPRRRRGSDRATVGSPLPSRSGAAAAGFFCDSLSDEEPRHFLDSCFLCKSSLAGNHDIFMYRGDTPFCSEECRQEQIDMDEAKEKNSSWKRMSSMKHKEQQNSGGATSTSNSQKIHVRATSTVVAG